LNEDFIREGINATKKALKQIRSELELVALAFDILDAAVSKEIRPAPPVEPKIDVLTRLAVQSKSNYRKYYEVKAIVVDGSRVAYTCTCPAFMFTKSCDNTNWNKPACKHIRSNVYTLEHEAKRALSLSRQAGVRFQGGCDAEYCTFCKGPHKVGR